MTVNYQYIMSKLGQSELQVGLGSILGSGEGGHRQYSDAQAATGLT